VRAAARELCGADGATFVLRDGPYCYYADEDAISPLWKGQRFPLETCISGWAMLDGRAAAIENNDADERIPHAAYRPTFVRSLAMVPIRRIDPIGAIGNYWAEQHQPTEEEIELLQALADSTAVSFAVTDTGVGIAPADQQRIFEEWVQGDAADGSRGAGLGLPFVRRVAELLDGELALQSEPGAGTTVTLTVPVGSAQ